MQKAFWLSLFCKQFGNHIKVLLFRLTNLQVYYIILYSILGGFYEKNFF